MVIITILGTTSVVLEVHNVVHNYLGCCYYGNTIQWVAVAITLFTRSENVSPFFGTLQLSAVLISKSKHLLE